MHKFAHMADIHLGASRDPILQKLELEVFGEAMDRCMQENVDFILVSGDIFHVGIPDLGIVNEASRKMREVQEAGIPIYVIYGSHDYTPTGTSVIDVLDTVGVLTRIGRMRLEDGKLMLGFLVDPKTGAKLTGMSARKLGLESKYFEVLDREGLEGESGFKVFAFHSGLTEFKPATLSEMETVPVSFLPRNFDYYAGGHIHERGEFELPGYEKVIFPGPLFVGYSGKDIEGVAKGEKRGFYLVSFDTKVRKVEFSELKAFDATYFEYDATARNSVQANKDLKKSLGDLAVKAKVVVLKIRGELSGGKTSDINLSELKTSLLERGALHVYINRHGLSSKEFESIRMMGEDVSSIESKLLRENIGSVRVFQDAIEGEKGITTALEFLKALRQGAKGGESKKDYVDRTLEGGLEVLGLKETIEEEIK